jgi:hypothetical protein
MKTEELHVLQCIDEAFAQATPIIHKESDQDFAIIQISHCGMRIKARVSTQTQARRIVNEMIAKMKSHPAGDHQTG